MTMKGPISEFNLRRNLETRKTTELRMMIRQIIETREYFRKLEEPSKPGVK